MLDGMKQENPCCKEYEAVRGGYSRIILVKSLMLDGVRTRFCTWEEDEIIDSSYLITSHVFIGRNIWF